MSGFFSFYLILVSRVAPPVGMRPMMMGQAPPPGPPGFHQGSPYKRQ